MTPKLSSWIIGAVVTAVGFTGVYMAYGPKLAGTVLIIAALQGAASLMRK